ncbi:MAG TPA: MauE/DoxX family redox-associated membrane protein, partial [Saprospiraceae bacterium]|nr:MauE/DoxX family redox-associated membrane protein [Saprospiraceae bacterium]
MKFLTLLLYIALVAGVLTGIIGMLKKGHKNWLMTFLQNFTGVLFIVSGFVKAVDPMGTAFKMEQYFTEFQYTFAETSFKFIAPLFPLLSSISLLFSITMIVLEIVVGVMLLLGHRAKLTSWIFL